MRPEMALVGENGPELVGLPGGARVFPTGSGPSGGGGVTIHAPITVNGFVGNPVELAKLISTSMINGFRSGSNSKTEFRAALGL